MDCLRDWPEPVVRVQSIADSGAKTIPERYVKPPSDRPSHAADAGSQLAIPVIDLADDERMIAADVASACEEWGFFQAVNHGVSPALMRRAREAWRGFFHLPMPEKQRYANSPATYEGYGSRLGVEKGSILDWGDYYFLHLRPRRLMSHEKWPSLPPCLRYSFNTRRKLKFLRTKRTVFLIFIYSDVRLCSVWTIGRRWTSTAGN